MKTSSTLVIAALLALFASGCKAVRVSQPVGEKPHPLIAAEWDGTWVNEKEGSIILGVDASTPGQLLMLRISEKDGRLALTPIPVQLRESGGWIFASTMADEEHKERGFVWGRLKKDGDQILIWVPDVAKFKQLVESGKVKGKGTGELNDVVLEPLTNENLKALISGELGVPFEWDEPMVFRRVSKNMVELK